MHLETTNKICALCKRLVAANGHPDATRLCEECRSLIQRILPKAGSNAFPELEQAHAYGQTHIAGAAQPALAASASFEEDLGDVEIVSRSTHSEIASFDPVADFDEVQPCHITRVETEYLDEFEAGDFEASDDEAYMSAEALLDPIDEPMTHTAEPVAQEPEVFLMPAQAEDFHQAEEFHNGAAAFEAEEFVAAPSEKTGWIDPSRDEESDRIISLPNTADTDTRAGSDVETSINWEAAKEAEAISGAEETSYQEAVDPWDDPLPAWDHSRNEYPLYVGIAERKRRSRLKVFVVPAIVLAGLIAAYLLFQSRDSAPQNQQAAESPAQGNLSSSLPVAAPQEPDTTKPASDDKQAASTSSGASDAQPAATVEKKEAPLAAATTETGAASEWRHALQALASPSADEASAFAAKLSDAGLPAYVIPADIANRGRWFRVRIGGFNTAQEALKFAAEARQRAKAAGVTLKDLNVVDYVKP